jgi:hypothetical protein
MKWAETPRRCETFPPNLDRLRQRALAPAAGVADIFSRRKSNLYNILRKWLADGFSLSPWFGAARALSCPHQIRVSCNGATAWPFGHCSNWPVALQGRIT